MQLNPNDPVEAVLIEMAAINRKKRADYTIDPEADPFGNFRASVRSAATSTQMTVADAIEFNIAQKDARLVSLRRSGRPPENESLRDTLLDRAVYSAISVAWADTEAKVNAPTVALTLPKTAVAPYVSTTASAGSTTTLLPRDAVARTEKTVGGHVYDPDRKTA